nr:reverse transcriptase domain-containing protein [Tanacetum cinerariifolium]GEV83382.1 reverse transcriptase domain-containing protein [Tanacetum cinerariifolium]
MQTRSSSKFVSESSSNPISTNLKHRNRRRSKPRVESFSIPIVTMADNRTMEEILQAPTEGYGDAIVETFGEAWERFKEMLRQCPHHGFSELHQIDTFYNGLNEHEQDSLNAATGGYLLRKTPRDALTIIENKSKVCYSRNKPIPFTVSTTSSGNSSSTDARIDKLADTISSLVETFNKKMTTPATVKAVKETCVICGAITTRSDVSYDGPPIPPPTSSLPKVVERVPEVTKDTVQPSTENIQPPVTHTQVPIDEPVVVPKPKLTIPYPSRVNKQKLHEKDDNLALKFVEMFRNLHFELSFADALLYMPKKLSFLELTSTQMILELAYRSTTRPTSIAEDVFVKVGKFHFPTNFVVVDYVVDPRLPLILERPFLRTEQALIDVYGEELTLHVDDEAITFKYVQEVLGFSDNSKSSNPTSISDPIIALSSPSLTPFDGGDFILEEIEACLISKSIPPGIDDTNFNLERDICLLKELLNKDPSSSPLLPKELNVEEIKTVKSSIDEPPKLELKELSSHLEYAFLEGTDKLPVIISKKLKNEEKSALLKVLKSHKQFIARKISDIKGIDPHFCTHKILIEDDFKPAVQHQRRVNLKIHEVIKKEVIKLLGAGLIYSISDSPWVSPVHCVPKKGGMTVVENKDNELIPTRLVTGWRVCIDYQKLNDAT